MRKAVADLHRNSKRLVERLREECGLLIDDNAELETFSPTYWQRSSGRWLWRIWHLGRMDIGSPVPISVLVCAKGLDPVLLPFGGAEIYPKPWPAHMCSCGRRLIKCCKCDAAHHCRRCGLQGKCPK